MTRADGAPARTPARACRRFSDAAAASLRLRRMLFDLFYGTSDSSTSALCLLLQYRVCVLVYSSISSTVQVII